VSIQPDEDISQFWSPQVIFTSGDANFSFAFMDGTEVYNLTGCDVIMTIKGSRFAPDSSGTQFTATITDPPTLGEAMLTIPQDEIPNPQVMWYRVDITSGEHIVPANFGPLTVMST
jgi:hypothetical protein